MCEKREKEKQNSFFFFPIRMVQMKSRRVAITMSKPRQKGEGNDDLIRVGNDA